MSNENNSVVWDEDPRETDTLTMKSGEKRDAHCKIYTEGSVKAFLEKKATDENISFSEVGRSYLLLGISAAGNMIEVKK